MSVNYTEKALTDARKATLNTGDALGSIVKYMEKEVTREFLDALCRDLGNAYEYNKALKVAKTNALASGVSTKPDATAKAADSGLKNVLHESTEKNDALRQKDGKLDLGTKEHGSSNSSDNESDNRDNPAPRR